MIIGVVGRKRAGKDALASELAKFGFVRVALADKLKLIVADLYGLSQAQLYGDLKEVVDPRWNLTPRTILQRMGTEVGRGVHPETWTRYLLDTDIPRRQAAMALIKFTMNCDAQGHFVVADVRFANEVEAIRRAGGHVVRIVRYLPEGRVAKATLVVARWLAKRWGLSPQIQSLAERLSGMDCHPSELFVDTLDVDAEYINDGPIERLGEFAADIVQRFL